MSRLVDKYDALTPRYRLGEEFGKFMLRLFRRQESAEAQQARDNLSIIGSLAAHGAVRITYPPRSSEIGVHTVVELPAVGDQQPSAPVECISYGIGGGVIYGLENEALRERAQLYLEVIGDIHNAAKEHGVAAHGLTRSLVFARGGYEGAA